MTTKWTTAQIKADMLQGFSWDLTALKDVLLDRSDLHPSVLESADYEHVNALPEGSIGEAEYQQAKQELLANELADIKPFGVSDGHNCGGGSYEVNVTG